MLLSHRKAYPTRWRGRIPRVLLLLSLAGGALLQLQPAAWAQPGGDGSGVGLPRNNKLWDKKPEDGWVVWASNRLDGVHEIYLMNAAGQDDQDVTRLTYGGGKMPIWSPDGRWIAYHDTSDGGAHVMRWDWSEDRKIFHGPPLFWMSDNSGVVCRDGDDFTLVEPDLLEETKLFSKSDFPQLASSTMDPGGITADGRWLLVHTRLFRDGYTADNGSFKWGDSAVILDLTDRERLFFFGPGCEPTAAPVGDLIYHVCGDFSVCPSGPDIYQMNVNDFYSRASYAPEVASSRSVFGHEYFPRVSTDNKWMVYGATDGCHDHENCNYEIFVHPLEGGPTERTRITFNAGNDQWPHLYVGPLRGRGTAFNQQSTSRLRLSSDRLLFSATQDQSPQEQRIAVEKRGTDQLGQLFTDVKFSSTAGWLTVRSAEEGEEHVLINRVQVHGLEPGRYTATVDLLEAGTTDSPTSYEVELSLADSPRGCGLIRVASPGFGEWITILAGLLLLQLLLRALRPLRRKRSSR